MYKQNTFLLECLLKANFYVTVSSCQLLEQCCIDTSIWSNTVFFGCSLPISGNHLWAEYEMLIHICFPTCLQHHISFQSSQSLIRHGKSSVTVHFHAAQQCSNLPDTIQTIGIHICTIHWTHYHNLLQYTFSLKLILQRM